MKILMDTRGPEIRTGTFEVYNSKKELKAPWQTIPIDLIFGMFWFTSDFREVPGRFPNTSLMRNAAARGKIVFLLLDLGAQAGQDFKLVTDYEQKGDETLVAITYSQQLGCLNFGIVRILTAHGHPCANISLATCYR